MVVTTMPDLGDSTSEPAVVPATDEKTQDTASSKPISGRVGIIYPPPEIRNIVDKTASFVARNGPEFESRIKQNEASNVKFNFLNPGDPYHAYYQHRVQDFKDGKAVEPSAGKTHSGGPQLPSKVQEAVKAADAAAPKVAPPDFEFSHDPATINAFELDVIRLTAQFVARNGRSFLTQLMQRESRNPSFDFLRPQHSSFHYFTYLVEQYTKVLIPPKNILIQLKKEGSCIKTVMDQVKYRVDWENHIRRQKEKEEAAIEKERTAYAQIDWHDFVVVQTVDFQLNEQCKWFLTDLGERGSGD